jgi:hypothetical protein
MRSIGADTIVCASLDAGFPTIPWQLSRVCNKFTFHLASSLPSVKFNMLQQTFAGTIIVYHPIPGITFLKSYAYSAACQGIYASSPIAGTATQQAWFWNAIGHTESACGANITCMILSIPLPSPSTRGDPFNACMI